MFTNIASHGGKFLDVVDQKISTATDILIATGYTSYDILTRYRNQFIRISNNGGCAKLLLGMAFYEGLAANKLAFLQNLSAELESINESCGVFVTYSGKFHGKVYKFINNGQEEIYLGSSNFSRSGLSENIETTALITNESTIDRVNQFLDFLLSPDNAVSISNADITVPGTTRYIEHISLETLDDLARYDQSTIHTTQIPYFQFPLSRIVANEKSSLNVYFGKGRLNRQTGFIRPRPWYEVELIANSEIYRNPIYPHGDFSAYTDDGYIIPMKTSGDNFKNIRSRGNLRILGQWIKGKLQRSNALIPLTPVTEDTLDIYGNDVIKFYQIDDSRYYMEF